MDEGKFFRGLSKAGGGSVSPGTMQRMLELDDRLLGYSKPRKKKGIQNAIAFKIVQILFAIILVGAVGFGAWKFLEWIW